MRSKIESYLGFARKAGKVIFGYRTCRSAVSAGNSVKLIVVASDAARGTRDKFRQMCDAKGIPFRLGMTSERLSAAAGISGAGVFGILDEGFADVIMKEIENENVVRM